MGECKSSAEIWHSRCRTWHEFWHSSEPSHWMEAIEHADAGGERNERVLRGDRRVVQARREEADVDNSGAVALVDVLAWILADH